MPEVSKPAVPNPLRKAFLEYTEAAMRELQKVCPPSAAQPLTGLDEWRRDSDGVFRLYDREEPYWVRCIRTYRERLHSLPEYTQLVAVLRNDPEIAMQIDTLVGTVYSARRIEIDQIADHLLFAVPREAGALRFDEVVFDRILDEFERDLRRNRLGHILLVPLLGVSMEQAPIQLASGLEIDVMKDEEIVRCLQVGLLPDELGMQRMRLQKQEVGLRITYDLDRRIGEQTPPVPQPNAQQETVERAMAVLRALRVFKEGRVSIPGLVHFSTSWPVAGGMSFTFANPGPMPWFNKYELSRQDCQALIDFWRQFEAVTQKGALANAVRRFSYASERGRPDDQLIDLMIAAESLFLSDAGSPEDRGELRYRLALRAAFFIDSQEYSRREIYSHMRRAYGARSTIVHGSEEVAVRTLKSPKGEATSLDEFTRLTERIMRAALQKAVRIAKPGSGMVLDWEGLIMPNETQ